jgi:ATP-dependent Lon protease
MFFGRDDKKDAQRRPQTVPLLPLRDIIVFPHMVVPLFVGRERSIAALKDAHSRRGPDDKAVIVLSAQKKAKTNDPTPDDIFHFGTLGHVIQLLPLPDGTVKVLVEGVRRARILSSSSRSRTLRRRWKNRWRLKRWFAPSTRFSKSSFS